MNLDETIKVHTIAAGGPGSGRHPEGGSTKINKYHKTLTKAGFTYKGKDSWGLHSWKKADGRGGNHEVYAIDKGRWGHNHNLKREPGMQKGGWLSGKPSGTYVAGGDDHTSLKQHVNGLG